MGKMYETDRHHGMVVVAARADWQDSSMRLILTRIFSKDDFSIAFSNIGRIDITARAEDSMSRLSYSNRR